MDRRKLKSSFRLARSQSLQRSVSINKVSASTIEETFWFGSVEQKIRTEWQKVWIRLNKRSILSYKEEVINIFLYKQGLVHRCSAKIV